MKTSEPLISIVVPIYNASNYILNLISDIQGQTYFNWELLLIDDGSQDDSYNICKNASTHDIRIKVFHQENQGPSAARNLGIDKASGEWITFIDADDRIFDDFLSSIVAVSHGETEIDLIYAGYIVATSTSNDVYTYNTKVYYGYEEVKKLISTSNILHRCSPWGKLFRRNLMIENNIKFDVDLTHSEDRLFLYNYLVYVRGIATTSVIGYLYDSTQAGTLKNQKLSVESVSLRQLRLTAAAHTLIEFFKLEGEACFPIAKHLFQMYSKAIQDLYYANGFCKKTVLLQEEFSDNFFDLDLLSEINNNEKWKYLMSENIMMRYAIDRRFQKINLKLSIIELKIFIYRNLMKFLRNKRCSKNISSVVHILNN